MCLASSFPFCCSSGISSFNQSCFAIGIRGRKRTPTEMWSNLGRNFHSSAKETLVHSLSRKITASQARITRLMTRCVKQIHWRSRKRLLRAKKWSEQLPEQKYYLRSSNYCLDFKWVNIRCIMCAFCFDIIIWLEAIMKWISCVSWRVQNKTQKDEGLFVVPSNALLSQQGTWNDNQLHLFDH